MYIFHKSISFFNQSCRSRLNKPSNLFSPKKTIPRIPTPISTNWHPLWTHQLGLLARTRLKISKSPFGHIYRTVPRRPVSCCVLFLECFFLKRRWWCELLFIRLSNYDWSQWVKRGFTYQKWKPLGGHWPRWPPNMNSNDDNHTIK